MQIYTVPYLLEQGKSNTSTEELAQMLIGEFTKDLEYLSFDFLPGLVKVSRFPRNGQRSKIGVVDGIVDGNSNLKLSIVVDRACSNTCPHRLESRRDQIIYQERSSMETYGETGERRDDIGLLVWSNCRGETTPDSSRRNRLELLRIGGHAGGKRERNGQGLGYIYLPKLYYH
jgi:hypothetical protein